MLITNIDEKTPLTQSTELKQPAQVNNLTNSKKEQNTAIVQAQMEVSIKMGNEPMALLYKTTLDAINEVLDPTLATKPIQTAYDNQVDVSPEATAERIVSFSTGFYHAFLEQNADITPEESLGKFMDVISGGIEQGFKDARDILESLSVLEGNIETDIDNTYDLVQEGLSYFSKNFFNTDETTNESTIQA